MVLQQTLRILPSRRHVALGLSGVLLGGALTGLASISNLSSATADPVATHIGGTEVRQLSEGVAATFPAGVRETVWLSAPGNGEALGQANSNAAQFGGVALAAADTSQLIQEQLQDVQAATVYLVGPPTAFPVSLESDLQPTYVVDSDYASQNTWEWSPAFHDTSFRQRIVIADPSNQDSVALGAAEAITSDASLLLLSGTEDIAVTTPILDDATNETITLMGNGPASTAVQGLSDESHNRINAVELTDLATAELDLIYGQLGRGGRALSLVASPSRGVADLATAARFAKSRNAIVGSEQVVEEFLGSLGTSAAEVSLVGVGATGADAVALAAVQDAPIASPPARVTDVTRNDTADSHQITVTPVAGASRYAAYDLAGVEVGASTTNVISLNGEPTSTAIVALNSAGNALKTIQFRVNDFTAAGNRSDVVLGSTAGTQNHLVFLDGSQLPRLVTRTRIGIAEQIPDPSGSTTTVAVTCEESITDTALDQTYQYDYRVTTLSRDPASCDAAGAARAMHQVGGVTFPATEFPAFARGSTTQSEQDMAKLNDRKAPAALSSKMESVMSAQASREPAQAERSTMAAGDGWASIRFRYQTFIPYSKIVGAGFGTFTRPFVAFSGDNRYSYHPNGSYRTRQDAVLNFGSSHSIGYTEQMGETKRYACRWPNLTNCELRSTARAPLSQLAMTNKYSYNTGGAFNFKVDAKNPLQTGAPAITSNIRFNARKGGTTVTGSHDKMPVHEIWWTVEGWGEWYWLYGSGRWSLPCLAGGPFCTAKVNLRL